MRNDPKAAAARNVAAVMTAKVRQAQQNGASEDQAIEAVRALWLGYLLDINAAEAGR